MVESGLDLLPVVTAFYVSEPVAPRGIAIWMVVLGDELALPGAEETLHWGIIRQFALRLTIGGSSLRYPAVIAGGTPAAAFRYAPKGSVYRL